MIVVYSSQSGSTERFAKIIAGRLGIEAFSLGSQPDDDMVYMGWLKGNTIAGIKKVDISKVVAVVSTCVKPDSILDVPAIRKANGISCDLFFLRGWIRRECLTFGDKMVFAIVGLILRLKGLDEGTRALCDAMKNGGDFIDDSELEPVIAHLKR